LAPYEITFYLDPTGFSLRDASFTSEQGGWNWILLLFPVNISSCISSFWCRVSGANKG
jgi:hypothetical protein